jgi:hypothetical protein
VIWKKAAVLVPVLALGVLAIGYISAWSSLDSCAAEVFRETQQRNVAGIDLQRNLVRPTRNDVTARISGPFLVEVTYMLPRGLHGSIYYTHYVVIFWYRHQSSSDVVHLVNARPHATDLSANNSFKPNPLRGSA